MENIDSMGKGKKKEIKVAIFEDCVITIIKELKEYTKREKKG